VYGEKLFFYLLMLYKQKKIEEVLVARFYLLSVDWPKEIKCEKL
jgi:hypothetical protein